MREGTHAGLPAGRPQRTPREPRGAPRAKVLLTSSYLFVGSTNYTTRSQANVEACVQIALSTEGRNQMMRWFDDLWTAATPHVCLGAWLGAISEPCPQPGAQAGRTVREAR